MVSDEGKERGLEKLVTRINVAVHFANAGEGIEFLLTSCVRSKSVRTNVHVIVYCHG